MKREELLEWLNSWRDYCGESCIKGECIGDIEKCEPAYTEIAALIRKPEVTEKWIEEKAIDLLRLSETIVKLEIKKAGYMLYCNKYEKAKDFIYSLVEEIVATKKSGNE